MASKRGQKKIVNASSANGIDNETDASNAAGTSKSFLTRQVKTERELGASNQFNVDESVESKNSRNKRGKGKGKLAKNKKRIPEKYAAYAAYRGRTISWILLSQDEKRKLALKALEESENKYVKCLVEKCSKKLKTSDEIITHVDKCLKLPEYFNYMGRAEEFRALESKTRHRLVCHAMKKLGVLPCLNMDTLNCDSKYVYRFGLNYHLDRCGVSHENFPPWKCYRCRTITSFAESRVHLMECVAKRESDECSESDDNESASKLRKLKSNASVARGYVPENNPRTKISKSGLMRYKFRNSVSSTSSPSGIYINAYKRAVKNARNRFNTEQAEKDLCAAIANFKHSANNWTILADKNYSAFLQSILKKSSLPVKLPKLSKEKNSSSDAQRLPIFVSNTFPYWSNKKVKSPLVTENDILGHGSIVYCGGPISTIRSCPRKLVDGRDCVAVSVYADEEYLVSKSTSDMHDVLQFWLYQKTNSSINITLWFLLEVKLKTILCTVWCPSLKGTVGSKQRLSHFVGVIAVGGIGGAIHFYGIHSDLQVLQKVANNDNLSLFCAKPNLTLTSPECCLNSPVLSIAWSEFDGSSTVAAVHASGHIVVWDLRSKNPQSKVIFEDNWSSPPSCVTLLGSERMVVAFRERLLRVYNLTTGECLIEEATPRTAGLQVECCQQIFSGVFSYQPDYNSNGDRAMSSSYYIDVGKNKIFVVPLANKHEVQLWDLKVCPTTGTVLSVGADGRLVTSINGRLAPYHANNDFSFNHCKIVFSLVKKLKDDEIEIRSTSLGDDDETQGTSEPPIRLPATNYELCTEKHCLEFSFDDFSIGKPPLPQYSLDIRSESLNRLAVSETGDQIAVCGGEAGLLIFIAFEQ